MANEFVVRNGFISQNNSIITGSLNVTGSVQITGSLFVSNSIDSNNRILLSNNGINSLSWQERVLLDNSGNQSADWRTRVLLDGTETTSIDWENRTLSGVNGGSLIWDDSTFYPVGDDSVDLGINPTNRFRYGYFARSVTAASFYGDLIGTASFASASILATSASTVLVDREGVNGPAYLTYVDSSNPSGDYERLYSNDSLYFSGSTLFSTRVNSSFTGSLLGTSSYAVTSSYVQSVQSASFATTASFVQLAQSASSVLVDRELVNGPAYLIYVDQADPNGAYVKLYNNNAIYLTGSTLIIPRVESSFTGSLLGTASFATQALSASWAPGGGNIDTSSFVTQGQVTALVSCRYLFSGF